MIIEKSTKNTLQSAQNAQVTGIVIGILILAGGGYYVYVNYIKPKLDTINKII